ncbi:MAG: hypothetical protein ABWX92_13705 [Mycetocola sp.]
MGNVEVGAFGKLGLDPSTSAHIEVGISRLQQAVEALEAAHASWFGPFDNPYSGQLFRRRDVIALVARDEGDARVLRQQIRPLMGKPGLTDVLAVADRSDQQHISHQSLTSSSFRKQVVRRT